MRELKVLAQGTASSRSILPSELPFDVQLTIDLAELVELTGSSLEYTVLFYARRLEDHARHTLAEVRGAITAPGSLTITAEAKPVPEGMYRLRANATLLSTGEATRQSILSAAYVKGGMLLIY